MQAKQKVCTLVLDEMTIKEGVSYDIFRDEVEGLEDFGSLGRTAFIANHAVTFMVRGLCDKWKQPVAYFLSSGPMDGIRMGTLVKECIERVEKAGLVIKVIVCDQGTNNRQMFEAVFGTSAQWPYFRFNGHLIFTMYDPPHLIKNIRNNLKKHGFQVADKDVRWKHIADFYAADSKLPIKMAPKLTQKHIELPPFSPLRVKLATQVLSHSVAAGITTMVSLGALPKEAQPTADFAEKMVRLFNYFNSQTMSSAAPLRSAITADSDHIAFLTECRTWLLTIKSGNGRKPPCLVGWQMAINCLLLLWLDLQEHHDFTCLLTNRLNQDCLENLFSVIRGKGGQRDNPDPVQFRTAFRQVSG